MTIVFDFSVFFFLSLNILFFIAMQSLVVWFTIVSFLLFFSFFYFFVITLNALGNELCIWCWSSVFLLLPNFEVTFVDYIKPLLWIIWSNKFDYDHLVNQISTHSNARTLIVPKLIICSNFFWNWNYITKHVLKRIFQLFLQRNLWPCVFHQREVLILLWFFWTIL